MSIPAVHQNGPQVEHKTIAMVDAKALDENGRGRLTGYGAIKNNIDEGNDMIVDGAFIDLDMLVKDGFNAHSHHWNVDSNIGYVVEAREDEKGLYFEMEFHSTQKAQDVRTIVMERLAAGKTVGLSIGYEAVEVEYANKDGKQIRILKKIRVYEISVVTIPMNPLAMVTGAKDKRDINDFYTKGNGVPLDAQFDFLTAEAADLSRRLDDIAKDRPAEWREEKAQRLITIADTLTQAATAVKSLNGADEIEPPKAANADLVRRAMELAQTSN